MPTHSGQRPPRAAYLKGSAPEPTIMSLATIAKTLFAARTQKRDEPERVLNEAMSAYLQTIPSEERLKVHLQKTGRTDELAHIKEGLCMAISATERHLYAQATGVRWTSEFEAELFEHIRQTCPWLDQTGFLSLKSFGQWLCWHEGLNAQPEA